MSRQCRHRLLMKCPPSAPSAPSSLPLPPPRRSAPASADATGRLTHAEPRGARSEPPHSPPEWLSLAGNYPLIWKTPEIFYYYYYRGKEKKKVTAVARTPGAYCAPGQGRETAAPEHGAVLLRSSSDELCLSSVLPFLTAREKNEERTS